MSAVQMQDIRRLWESGRDTEIRRFLQRATSAFVILKTALVYEYLSKDPARFDAIIETPMPSTHPGIRLLQILRAMDRLVHRQPTSDQQQQQANSSFPLYALLSELQTDYLDLLGSVLLLKIWRIVRQWSLDAHNDATRTICSHLVESAFTQPDVLEENTIRWNTKVLQAFAQALQCAHMPLDDRISILSHMYEVHHGKAGVAEALAELFQKDKTLKSHVTTFATRAETPIMEPVLLSLFTEEDKRRIFHYYLQDLSDLLVARRRDYNRLGLYKRLAQWSLSLIEPSVQQRQRRSQYRNLRSSIHSTTISTVLHVLQRVDSDVHAHRPVDPVVFQQLREKVRASVADSPVLRRYLLLEIQKRQSAFRTPSKKRISTSHRAQDGRKR